MGILDWFRKKPVAANADADANTDADADADADANTDAAADDADADANDADADADADDDADADADAPFDESIAPPLTDELDLHTFQPRDVKDLVEEYLHAAQDAGFASVRIIHGKGKGTLRRIVHGVCEKHPVVASFQLADQRSGSWGATLVAIKPKS